MRNDYQPRTVPDKISPVGAVETSSVRTRTQHHDPDDKPQPPVNFHLEFWVRELHHHLVYNAKAICDPRTPDTCQADIDEYVFQIRPTDVNGIPTEATNDKRTLRVNQHDVADGNTDLPHVVFTHIERPGTLYWQLRVRVKDKNHRKSPWTIWTMPLLPGAGSLPKPPTPTGLTLKWDRVEKTKHAQFRAIVKCNDVGNWQIPGDDDEEDVARYIFQLQRTDSGGTPVQDPDGDQVKRTITVEDKDDPAANKPHAIFTHIGKWGYWRARVRSVDKYNRRGDWTSWTAHQRPSDSSKPPNVTSPVAITLPKQVGIGWTIPANPDDPDMPDEDISHYQVQRSTDAGFASITDNHLHVVQKQVKWKGTDNVNYWARVRSIRSDGQKGDWITVGPMVTDNSSQGGVLGMEPGTIIRHATAVPNTWAANHNCVRCNGAFYDPTDPVYAPMFAEIGYTWGQSGSLFAVPDSHGRHLIDPSTAIPYGSTDGDAEGTRAVVHIHASDFTAGVAGTDDADIIPLTDNTNATPVDTTPGEAGHTHALGGQNTSNANGGSSATVGGGNQAGAGHTHILSGFTSQPGASHNHPHTHGPHPHPHGHGSHRHDHGHFGGHPHPHPHDVKKRPHAAIHLFIKL